VIQLVLAATLTAEAVRMCADASYLSFAPRSGG
jgi:hypothetical protein